MSQTIFLAAGGTGGHIAPGVALVQKFTEKGISVVFFTLEKNRNYADVLSLMKNPSVKVVYYPAPKIPEKPFMLFRFLKELFLSIKYIHKESQKNKAQAIIGMGGYPSFPLLLYGFFKKIPIFLCEQNAKWGFVTKLFAPFSKKVFLSFPSKKSKANFVFSGNPLRAIFSENFAKKNTKFQKKIFMLGGSQGAKHINELYLTMINDPFFKDWEITLSTGKEEYLAIKEKARKKDRIFSFVEDMPKELLNAELILCRAGSGTLYEVVWAGKPAILFPYPYATDNHQWYNALYLKNQGVAEIIDIRPFSTNLAVEKVKEILKDKNFQKMQKEAQKRTALPLNARELITKEVLSFLS